MLETMVCKPGFTERYRPFAYPMAYPQFFLILFFFTGYTDETAASSFGWRKLQAAS